mgnify:CR=1 FL=1
MNKGAKRQGLNKKQEETAKLLLKQGKTVEEVSEFYHVAESYVAKLAPKRPAAKKKPAKKKPTARKKTSRAGSPDGESN